MLIEIFLSKIIKDSILINLKNFKEYVMLKVVLKQQWKLWPGFFLLCMLLFSSFYYVFHFVVGRNIDMDNFSDIGNSFYICGVNYKW